ncbi:hypothetical protein [Kitasatospora sp. MBT63]|uniref:hypothetical protein n=1 Tax=Kitasatospora sp. MBT63 TaxID=1444768 RepID=UPI0006920B88|nr:hypothetical protein [Kitasatospora sp. MBT63]
MSTRTRSRRTYGRAPLKLSSLNPANINLAQASIVCPECDTWRRIVGTTDLKLVGHERGKSDRCPGGNRQFEVDLTPDRWLARLRRQQLDALSPETRRAATQHYKPVPAQPGPVHLMAASRPEVEYTAGQRIEQARKRMEQWKKLQDEVKDANGRRAEPLVGAVGPIRGIEVPKKTLHPAA